MTRDIPCRHRARIGPRRLCAFSLRDGGTGDPEGDRGKRKRGPLRKSERTGDIERGAAFDIFNPVRIQM